MSISQATQAIGHKRAGLAGATSTTEVRSSPDGSGYYRHYEHSGGEPSSIYWHPDLGAFEVAGRVRDLWALSGWERGALGYPVADEVDYARDGVAGRLARFERGVIFCDDSAGTCEAFEVLGGGAWDPLDIGPRVREHQDGPESGGAERRQQRGRS